MAADPLTKLRRIALALPGAWEKVSHGEPTFWVGKRMFASYANAANHHGAGRTGVWCKADHLTQTLLLSKAPTLYFSPPYVGPSGWVGMYLDAGIDWQQVAERLDYAYRLARAAPAARKRPVRSPINGSQRRAARRRG
jgi:hypothetical protein